MRLLGMSFRERLFDIFNRKPPSRKDADADGASTRLLAGPFKGFKTGLGAVQRWSLPRRLKNGAKKKLLWAAGLVKQWDEFLEAKLWPWLETVGKDLARRYRKLAGKAGAKHWGAWHMLGEKMVDCGVVLKRLGTSSADRSDKKSKRSKKKSDKELCKRQCEKAERAAKTAVLKAGEARQALYEVLRLIEMW